MIPLLREERFERRRGPTAAHFRSDADVGVTKNLLAALTGPVVLVGHSYGGVVVSGAANGMPNVKALVYIAAFALDEGESIEGLGKQGPAPARRCGRASARRQRLFVD